MSSAHNSDIYRPFSVPHYRQAAPKACALHHLLVLQTTVDELPESLQAFVRDLPRPILLSARSEGFDKHLDTLLYAAPIGSHLYVLGDEAFLWRVHVTAQGAGMLSEEIDLIDCGPAQRRVFCVHCGLIQDAPAVAQLNCTGCQVQLGVREHFSKRLGAYMGVCENPDQAYAQVQRTGLQQGEVQP
ncbi:dimethylamine monooxygenase subunit DmmA family protein [Pseudomonas sp. Pseusp122]|uniref:dimethylamine monooxygenase subunit DmmA family protein n=1 Tax=unclassified Pseudomonas TaxID=196821 RepID=UPI0039A4B0E7